MSLPIRERVPTRLDEISKDDEALRKRLKNFERIPDDELESVAIGTFIKFLRFKDGEWKFRSGGLLYFNGFPEYFCVKFRYSNGRWKPHNIAITKDIIFFRSKRSEYTDAEIKNLLDSLKRGYLKLIRSEDLKKLTLVYNKVQKHNGIDKIPPLLHTTDLLDESDEDIDDRNNAFITLVTKSESDEGEDSNNEEEEDSCDDT